MRLYFEIKLIKHNFCSAKFKEGSDVVSKKRDDLIFQFLLAVIFSDVLLGNLMPFYN